MTRDDKIKNGNVEIAKRLEDLENKYSQLSSQKVKTNCRLTFPDNKDVYNIRTISIDDMEFFKAKLLLYKQLLPERVKISGYTLNEWVDDLTLLISKKSIADEISTLKSKQSKLTELYSDDAKADIAVDEILNSL